MVRIHRGLPGSGKSTRAQQLLKDLKIDAGMLTRIFSADDYMVDKEGKYSFNANRLEEVHAACLRDFLDIVKIQPPSASFLIVDNTNISIAEIAPYAAVAKAFKHVVELVTYDVPAHICYGRNVHGVPLETIVRMEEAMKEQKFPRWWKHEVIALQGVPARAAAS